MLELARVVLALSPFVEFARDFTFGLSLFALSFVVGGLCRGGGLAFPLLGRWALG